jgi:hypothetical protein
MPNAEGNDETAEILRLYDEGLTDEEIAQRLGLPRASVRARKAHRTMGTYGNAEPKTVEAATAFTWIPIYIELARKILAFRTRQDELIDMLKELKARNLPVVSIVDRDQEHKEIPLAAIDPFTFFASFNRALTKENRLSILAYLRTKFELSSELPTDFVGIPVVNFLAARFFHYASDRQPEDIPSLWALAEAVVTGPPENLDPKLFNRCLEIETVGPAKLTMGMFWLNPKQYIAWDANNRELFARVGIIDEVTDFTTYLQLVRDVNAKLGADYPTISRTAWERSSKQFWAGGFQWGDTSKLDEFIRGNFWQIGWRQTDTKPAAKKTWSYFDHVREGDEFAIKGYGGRNDLRIHYIGEVVGKTDDGILKLKQIDRPLYRDKAPKGLKGATWFETLVPIKSQSTIDTIFHGKGKDQPGPVNGSVPPIWIEKTLVKGRADRESGDHKLGAALWSPQKAKNGADIYQNMRAVQEGDIILHLTDNKQFSGVSVAAGRADDTFEGLPNTAWQGPAYRVPLRDYIPLDPPLSREDFLESPVGAAELTNVHEQHQGQGLFYTADLDLNQGKYLTRAPIQLVEALSRIYSKLYGKGLPHLEMLPSIDVSEDVGTYSIDDAISGIFLGRRNFEEMLLLLDTKKNIILQGPPGVGKTFIARRLAYALLQAEDDARVKFLQFHQSYSYEDFIEGYRPKDGTFVLRKGLFRSFCDAASEDSGRKYVLVIDEVNRGNLSKIFGELLMLIEPDKRSPAWNVQLAYSGDDFHVPPNLHLIGLMNTADRSLAMVDYALRRRFTFFTLDPEFSSPDFSRYLESRGVSGNLVTAIVGGFETLNKIIADDTTNLGPGFCIGHSFFCPADSQLPLDETWYRRVIKTEVAPLLREYWFDRPKQADEMIDQLLKRA